MQIVDVSSKIQTRSSSKIHEGLPRTKSLVETVEAYHNFHYRFRLRCNCTSFDYTPPYTRFHQLLNCRELETSGPERCSLYTRSFRSANYYCCRGMLCKSYRPRGSCESSFVCCSLYLMPVIDSTENGSERARRKTILR